MAINLYFLKISYIIKYQTCEVYLKLYKTCFYQ